jgi:Zn-dependent peptidase ImmA (M78 family)
MVKLEISEYEKFEITRLAQDQKRKLGYVGAAPIANDLINLLEQLHIILLETPIESDNGIPSFSAAILCIESQDLTFIGINTSDYYDNQLFSLAHELYHYFAKSGYHLSRINDEKNSIIEMKANYFASEFIFPKEELSKIIFEEFKSKAIKLIEINKIIRLIARIYCKWWLPYNYIVLKLFEIGAISKDQKNELCKYKVRDKDSNFAKICKTINPDVYNILNSITNKNSTSPEVIEIIIKNFEDNLISEDEFEQNLKLFNLYPSDFGYDVEIDSDDIDEFNSFFYEKDLKDES